MARQVEAAQQERQGMSGMERLSLRVSEMINHPVAQLQRWVLIHRIDSDGDQEWEEALSQMAATDELELEHREDGSVLVRWEELEKTGTPGVDEWEQDSGVKADPWAANPDTSPF
ncbi:DUF1654 domain-containing protein [Pseudomonas sp. CFBP 13719]|uniref:DUF1654 domain-containing protein n=1 Tax=Pseudomonas sp. CFBP 13719 TaxID=2775303 RepID=UPI00177B3F86|nr:DUF1654 domain-containing protein [Pseudomonas sp. CFBP 13719]MBD8680328.1 DUF1654 domain-containing protein [Pseudomonas sp. CFBP 13719]